MREVVLPAAEAELTRVIGTLDEELGEAGCDDRTRLRLHLAVEEVFVNIAHYAYPEGGGDMTFAAWTEGAPKRVVMRFVDSGIPYNPVEKEDPDVGIPASERTPGGLGVFLAKNNVDLMEYERRDGQNILTMVKEL